MINKTKIFLVVCLWFIISVAMILVNEKVFMSGEDIQLNVLPVDELFKEEHETVKVNLEISQLKLQNASEFKPGRVVYVTLEDENGVYKAISASSEKPKEGVYVKGHVVFVYRVSDGNGYVDIEYGVKNFFATKGKAAEIQKTLKQNGGGIAKAKLNKNGTLKILEII